VGWSTCDRGSHYTSIISFTTKIKINPKGFGFIDIPGKDSAFVSSNNVHGAMDDDEVEVIIMNDTVKKGSLIASVIRIVKRKNDFIYGSIKKNGEYFDFTPLNTKIKNRFRFINKEMLQDIIIIAVNEIIELINDEYEKISPKNQQGMSF
jgi:exoribonuclease R